MKLTLSIDKCPPGCNMEGQKHQFDTEGGSFGRGADNDWVLPDPSRYVSSQHGLIRCENNQFFLSDVSTNGIYLNGSAQPLGANSRPVLNNGDRLIFGDYQIQVNVEVAVQLPDAQPTPQSSSSGPGEATVMSGSSVLVDDLDKWLEPVSPTSGSDQSPQTSLNISSSPSVKPMSDIGLGLKAEEKDPLALLGAGQREKKSSHMQSAPKNAALSDLLGDASPLDQQMMKVPNVIPDDWDDLLGVNVPDKPAAEDAILDGFLAGSSLNAPSEQPASTMTKEIDLDATSLDSVQSRPVSEPLPSEPLSSEPAESPVVPSQLADLPEASMEVPVNKAPEDLGLSELLAIPSEQLTSNAQDGTKLEEPQVVEASLTDNDQPKKTPSMSATAGLELAQALGLERLSEEQVAVLNDAVANTVKETVSGMMRTLRARSEIKSEFRLNMTTIQSAENNPLKFSVTPEDAIENMFAKQGKAYLSPTEAINDGFADIADHQVALFDAMKAAYEHILGQFDPGFLARKFEKTSSKRFLGGSKGKNWDAYQALFDEFKNDQEATFKELFGGVFADAYERRMHSLKLSRNSSKRK